MILCVRSESLSKRISFAAGGKDILLTVSVAPWGHSALWRLLEVQHPIDEDGRP